jgi:hypothetical protein
MKIMGTGQLLYLPLHDNELPIWYLIEMNSIGYYINPGVLTTL